jgi:hypothetical protein
MDEISIVNRGFLASYDTMENVIVKIRGLFAYCPHHFELVTHKLRKIL